MASRDKILFIIIDQLRADCVTGALADHVDLPNVQALRKDAVTFTQHFSVSNPCGPSRASIFTGQYAMNHRSVRNGTPLAAGIPNIATEMRKGGYEPWLFGYADTSHDPRSHHPSDPDLTTEEGILPGFREIVEQRFQENVPWQMDLIAKGYDLPDYANIFDPLSPDPNRPARPDDPPFYSAADSDTAFLANRVIDHLSFHKTDNWFAVATFLRPHTPFVAPEPYNRMYAPSDLPMPDRQATAKLEESVHPVMADSTNFPPMENTVRNCVGQVDRNNDNDVQMLRSLYLGLATEVDAHIGRIIEMLKETEQYDATLIILQADHGEMLGDHHLWGKQHVYDPCYRIPLIIRDPMNSDNHGQQVNTLTESIDVVPTILELKNQTVPKEMNGKSLIPFLQGQTPKDWKDCVHLELDFGEPVAPTAAQQSVGLPLEQCNLAILREQRFKLVHVNGGLPPLLYDLENDPHEMRNLGGEPEHAATLLRLTQKLLSHRMTHNDNTLTGMRNTASGVFGYVPD